MVIYAIIVEIVLIFTLYLSCGLRLIYPEQTFIHPSIPASHLRWLSRLGDQIEGAGISPAG